MYRWSVSFVLAGLALSFASPLRAQSVAFRGSPAVQTTATSRVDLQLKDMPLALAIQTIADRTGMVVTFDAAKLPERRVTYSATKVSAEEALLVVLDNTGIAVRRNGNDRLTLVPVAVELQGVITGKIINAKTKRPVVGATITLDDATKGVQTGEDGTFRLPASVAGHVIRVRAVGFVRQTKEVSVTNGGNTIEIALEPSASVLDEVVVTGTVVATERKAIPTPITVITAEDIEKRGITRVDQLFRGEVPGVMALDMGSASFSDAIGANSRSTVFARGSASLSGGPNPLKTYVDGVELLDPAYLGTLDPKSIERIEIVTGPQAATLYGSGALGGVMQIFTKKGSGKTTPDVTLSLKYGALQNSVSDGITPSHNHTLNMTGGTGPEFSYSATVSYEYTGQWQPKLYNRAYGGSIGATHTRAAVTVSGSYTLRASQNGTIKFLDLAPGTTSAVGILPVSITLKDYLNDGTMKRNSGRQINQLVSRNQGQTGALNIDVRATPIWQHHLSVGRSQTYFQRDPLEPVYDYPFDSLYETSVKSGQRSSASYNTTLAPRAGFLSSTMTLGANGSWGDENYIDGCLTSRISTSYVGCYGGNATSSKSLASDSWGGFGSLQVGMFDQFFVTLGVRGERNPNYGSERKVDWTPTTGATFTAEVRDLTIKFLGSYGRATRPPQSAWRGTATGVWADITPSQYLYQFANPTLRPERSSGPQGGVELYYGNVASLTVNHFQQTVSDLIVMLITDSLEAHYVNSGALIYIGQGQYNNAAKMRQKGWEGTGTLSAGPFSLKGTYSWSDSRIVSVNTSTYGLGYGGISVARAAGQSFAYMPTHTGNVIVGYAHGGTSATVITNYIGSSTEPLQNSSAKLFLIGNGGRLSMYMDRASFDWTLEHTRPGYVRSDLVMSHRFTSAITGTLNVTNLANNFTSDLGALFPALGRQTLVGLSMRFP